MRRTVSSMVTADAGDPHERSLWKVAAAGLLVLAAVLCIGTLAFGLRYAQDQTQVQTLSGQLLTEQSRIQSLSSELRGVSAESNLAVRDAGAADNSLCMSVTNSGAENITVYASGVTVLAPNGSRYWPGPGHQVTFYVFPYSLPFTDYPECLPAHPPGGRDSPGNRTSATLSPGEEVWIGVTDASLEGLGPSGNYILLLSNVTSVDGKGVAVEPIWIPWTAPSPRGLFLTSYNISASGREGYDYPFFLLNNSSQFVYMENVTLSYGSTTCTSSSSENKAIFQNMGLAWEWSYTGGDPCPNSPAQPGTPYSGSVTLSSGRVLRFGGVFSG